MDKVRQTFRTRPVLFTEIQLAMRDRIYRRNLRRTVGIDLTVKLSWECDTVAIYRPFFVSYRLL
jgi:hypothetical protein